MADALHPVAQKFARHVNPALVRLLGLYGYGRVFVRAEGVWMWDHEGRKYLDFLAGFGASTLGHAHPALVAAMHAFLDSGALNLNHIGPSGPAADLAEALAARAGEGLGVAMFSSTGGEAVESALKLARAATRRLGFVYCQGGYHGTGLGPLSVMGGERWRAPFEPLLEHCEAVPFGDLAALEKALAPRRAAAFVVEPILGEGGVVLPPRGYLAEAQRLCAKFGTLLVLDEVQTGLGRTGTLFAFQAEGMRPDVLVLGKALGGGLAPVSATLTSTALHEKAYGAVDRFDLHGSTFSGNAFACAAAMATLRILDDEGLVAASAARGTQLLEGLRRRLAGHPLVREVRGRGLLVAVELGPPEVRSVLDAVRAPFVRAVSKNVFGQWLALRMLERGIVCQPAAQRWDVLRLEPPLTVQPAEVDHVVAEVGAVLDGYRELGPVLKDAGERLGRQLLSGWRF
jgi:putrescine aminotransferase